MVIEFCCSIKNACNKNSFDNFLSAFNSATIKSGSHGLGLILIKEFSRIINASVSLDYTDGWARMQILL